MTTAAELYALQEIDLALDRAAARLAEIEEKLVEPEEMLEVRQLVAANLEKGTGLRSRQTDLEWEVEEVRTKASQVEAKLYGGTVTSPKELSDLQADLTSLKGQVRKREDVLLALLVELDDAERELKQAEAGYAALEAEWRTGCDQLLAEKQGLLPEVEGLEARRAAEGASLDRAALGLYATLRERRAGQAVAKVERGMCQGCRITLPMSVLQKARTGAGLVQCVSCERILLVG